MKNLRILALMSASMVAVAAAEIINSGSPANDSAEPKTTGNGDSTWPGRIAAHRNALREMGFPTHYRDAMRAAASAPGLSAEEIVRRADARLRREGFDAAAMSRLEVVVEGDRGDETWAKRALAAQRATLREKGFPTLHRDTVRAVASVSALSAEEIVRRADIRLAGEGFDPETEARFAPDFGSRRSR